MMNLKNAKTKKSIKELLEFGIINIDKPSGPTSFEVSDLVRKILGVNKTSHFGTLDPKVTGVLPIALNRACKLTGFFLGHDKEYVGIMRFHEEVSIEKIKEAIKEKFTGIITQLPPVRSRVKRQEREREIKSFDIIEQDGKDFLFRAVVQGGTYIRKLIDDLEIGRASCRERV
jgi:H/ACA ribonucleoprotein complex subunit 4